MILGYWKIRGRGEPIRLLMEFLGVKYTEENPSFKQWFSKRDSMGMDFPNLPYLIDGNHKITESRAII